VSKWGLGMNLPFDPMPCKLAEKNALKVIVADGRNISNLETIIWGSEYKGT